MEKGILYMYNVVNIKYVIMQELENNCVFI